nr:PDDEXK nuclease domain-containing protein [Lachnospiraceae bacterium]
MAELQNNIVNDIRRIIDESRYAAFGAVNSIAVQTYWNIGKKIVEEEQHGQDRADYGKRLIRQLSDELTKEYGNAFSKRNLDYYRKFYICFRDYEIVNACVHNLTWTHFRRVLAVASQESREWYIREASEQQWSTRELDRNISTQYYERLLSSQREGLPLSKAVPEKADPLEYIKSPVVAEFLGFHNNSNYNESQLEKALIDNLEKFTMELGKGFAFVERQKNIVTETGDFYIDLVFYNYRMKCFVLFELKTHKLSHQDIGQIDMYVRMYDDTIKDENDNPTVGVLLCTDTD